MRILTAASLALTIAVAALPAPAAAGSRGCNASLVTAGVCRTPTNRLLHYDLPLDRATELVDAIADLRGYQAEFTCTQAHVDRFHCLAGEIGQTVQETKAHFADAEIRVWLRALVRTHRSQAAHADAEAVVDALPDLDIQ